MAWPRPCDRAEALGEHLARHLFRHGPQPVGALAIQGVFEALDELTTGMGVEGVPRRVEELQKTLAEPGR